jgi:hypothetical protein
MGEICTFGAVNPHAVQNHGEAPGAATMARRMPLSTFSYAPLSPRARRC